RTTWHKTVETIADYTGRPARRCDGTPLDGELVVEYRSEDGQGWTAAARTATTHEVLTPIFEMLDGGAAMATGHVRTVGWRGARGRPALGSIALDSTVGNPLPGAATGRAAAAPPAAQVLWIDVDALRPLRWEVSLPGAPAYALMFTYDRVPTPKIPDGVTAPD